MKLLSIFEQGKNKNSKTAEQRKRETEKFLALHHIPFIAHLPLVEEEEEVKIRAPQEITKRIIILAYLGYIGEVPESKQEVIRFLKEHKLWSAVTGGERKLFEKENLTEQERINISWKTEAIWVLLWSIGKVNKLDLPVQQVNIQGLLSLLPGFLSTPDEFIKTAAVRSVTEILDMLDLLYRIHWATRDAYLKGQPIPANLDEGIVMERHYAVNWLTCYAGDWDEITTDT